MFNSCRSTKSKARPGVRKGKWSAEEEAYAHRLKYYFRNGLLLQPPSSDESEEEEKDDLQFSVASPYLKKGTMLRMYLASKLNCEPMRITKKFTGEVCIGKQVFRPASDTILNKQRALASEVELAQLRRQFLLRANAPLAPVASSSSSYKRLRNCASMKKLQHMSKPAMVRPIQMEPRPYTRLSMRNILSNEDGEDAGGDISPPSLLPNHILMDDQAAGYLLLGFHRNATNEELRMKQTHTMQVNKPLRNFSISSCLNECEPIMKRPRVDSFTICN